MYDFHYNYFKTKYGDNAKLVFTDIDSLAYDIKTKDFYKDINPTLRIGLALVSIQLIHVKLEHDLIVKCLECLRMKLAGSRLLNLLV